MADLGFSRGELPTTKANQLFYPFFPKNCMNIFKILDLGGGDSASLVPPLPTLDPLMHFSSFFSYHIETSLRSKILDHPVAVNENITGKTLLNIQCRNINFRCCPPHTDTDVHWASFTQRLWCRQLQSNESLVLSPTLWNYYIESHLPWCRQLQESLVLSTTKWQCCIEPHSPRGYDVDSYRAMLSITHWHRHIEPHLPRGYDVDSYRAINLWCCSPHPGNAVLSLILPRGYDVDTYKNLWCCPPHSDTAVLSLIYPEVMM